jgi:hypothetical protein
MLAEKTGWSIDYILWEIPMAILVQGMHTYLYHDGAKVRRIKTMKNDEVNEVAASLGVSA